MAFKFGPEAKVGVFVLVTVCALVWLSIRINKSGFSLDKSKTIYIVFENASGILARTPVEYAGIRVGRVNSIKLDNGKARVEVQLDPSVPVFKDSYIALANRGILGEKIITISGGGNEPEVGPDGTISAASSGGGFDDALRNFNEVAQSVKDLIKGGQGKPSLKDIISNVTDITEDLRTLVRSNKKDLNNVIKNVHDFTEMLNNGDLREIISNLKTTSRTIQTFVKDANPQLKDVVHDFRGVMAKIDDTVTSLNRIVAKVERGEGTVGKLLSDDTTVNKVNDTLDGINDFVGRIKRLELSVGFSGEYLSDAKKTQTAASFKIQPAYDKYFLLEFTNLPIQYAKKDTTVTTTTAVPPGTAVTTTETSQSDKFAFTALYAQRFYDLTVKAGLMRSSGGFGLEYHLLHNHLSLGVDAFDFTRDEHVHVRTYAALHLFKVLHLTGGVDDVFQKFGQRNYFGGAGIMLTDNDLKTLIGVAPLVGK